MLDWRHSQDWMLLALILGLGLFALALWHVHVAQGAHEESDLFDLFKENGRLSRMAVGYMTILGIASWVMVDLELKGKMEAGYFIGYIGLITPIVTKMFATSTTAPTTTSTTKTETTEKTVGETKT